MIPTDGDADDVRLTIPGDDDGSMPGFGVVDIKGGWTNESGTQTYQAMIENIGNKTYREIGSGTDSAGFNLVLSAQMKF